jgi:hypothetical protein
MHYLKKDENSEVIKQHLSYNQPKDRNLLREQLLLEQKGFCAYSERYVKATDKRDIEHFDPRLKNTDNDNYYNWYVVLSWINEHKPKKIEPFLPILNPFSIEVIHRIIYEDGIFKVVRQDDIEAHNLIKFLGFNKRELTEDREKHIKRLQSLRELCGNDQDFIELLKKDKESLSFITALEKELSLNLKHLLEKS